MQVKQIALLFHIPVFTLKMTKKGETGPTQKK